ncbi:MAG TPA: hypothetical protein VFQ35_21745 [Polyangiaceae bacterium]|nr:hypothetical protein [Polyangiaceae bacterium]
MSDWFFMLGEPLSAAELEHVRAYLKGLDLDSHTPVESTRDFEEARRIISHPDWDRRWWDAEQRERERLRAKLAGLRESDRLSLELSQSMEQSVSAQHGAAAVEAGRLGCTDQALIRAAAGALGEALYLGKLAELSGEPSSHPFVLKQALFTGGHWPLGIVAGRYYVF